MSQNLPVFKFALRSDLEGDKRFLPKRATSKASGWDVFAAPENKKSIILRAGQYAKIPLGFRVIPPEGYWLELRPRSSTFTKKFLHCLYGVIDFDYRGFLFLPVMYQAALSALGKDLEIKYGEAMGQIIPIKLREMLVEEVSNDTYDKMCDEEINERGAGGFGSTSDKK